MSSQPPSVLLPDVSRARAIHRVFVWALLTSAPLLFVGDKVLLGVFGGVVLLYVVTWLALRRQAVTLGPEGLVRGSALPVPYGGLTSLRFVGYAVASPLSAVRSRYLLIGHTTGAFRIGRAPGLDRLELYRTLLERSNLRANPVSLPPQLERVLAAELADFGPERVLVTCGRPVDADDRPTALPLLGVALGTIIAVAAAASRSNLEAPDVWAVATFGLCAAFGWLVYRPLARLRLRAFGRPERDLGLVVSPRSITLESPSLKGTLRWSEVLELRALDVSSWIRRGLNVRVAGTVIRIPDAFCLPLTEIAALMHRYHGGA